MRLLIVDDSALMRRLLKECFVDESDVEIVAARDGEDALEKLHSFQPDVITLDINMPRMDGLTCLSHIMVERPCPVIMVSSLTEEGALATFEALELGAVDFVAKPDGTVSLSLASVFDELRAKVRSAVADTSLRKPTPKTATASRATPLKSEPKPAQKPQRKTVRKPVVQSAVDGPTAPSALPHSPFDLVLIGSSTGGPRTLGALLEDLPPEFPAPILIAQHMPPRFTKTFAERLEETCAVKIVEVDRPVQLEAGTVYIASGGKDVLVSHACKRTSARPVEVDHNFTWHPSVSRMVASATACMARDRLLGIMLTGMGDDGSREMAEIHRGGGYTIAESEETAVVFGMPQKLIEHGGASLVLPAHKIAARLLRKMNVPSGQRMSSCH